MQYAVRSSDFTVLNLQFCSKSLRTPGLPQTKAQTASPSAATTTRTPHTLRLAHMRDVGRSPRCEEEGPLGETGWGETCRRASSDSTARLSGPRSTASPVCTREPLPPAHPPPGPIAPASLSAATACCRSPAAPSAVALLSPHLDAGPKNGPASHSCRVEDCCADCYMAVWIYHLPRPPSSGPSVEVAITSTPAVMGVAVANRELGTASAGCLAAARISAGRGSIAATKLGASICASHACIDK